MGKKIPLPVCFVLSVYDLCIRFTNIKNYMPLLCLLTISLLHFQCRVKWAIKYYLEISDKNEKFYFSQFSKFRLLVLWEQFLVSGIFHRLPICLIFQFLQVIRIQSKSQMGKVAQPEPEISYRPFHFYSHCFTKGTLHLVHSQARSEQSFRNRVSVL